ncbi:zinc finger CW-type PWWP domain protein 1-like [Pectinophora gossypiella]|uniref:zinc finger CW-type PWWP domain protein 1-like n=1 Tax=Pectinophora gossypiella TaxID=13191 RepID=UPI00214F018F|nr:zinc finger CW-type PWWP domain protein 1-like [Pectinophora gossypiella]
MNRQKKGITFAEATQSTENSTSQNSSTYKDALSQPAGGLTHRQRLLWLQKRRSAGLWVQCDDCDRWRYLPHVLDAQELPDKWSCNMNPDKTAASCSVPEVPIRLHDEEDLIHGEYAAGSLVWAQLAGWPWWPAMVDDCPDTEQYYWLDGFSDIPTHYNVVFFDAFDVTRAWIAPKSLVSFGSNKSLKISKDKRYRKRLEVSIKQAEDASKMSVSKRLAKYSFIARYPGSINQPKKINKNELEKFQKKLKRKYDIEFPNESESSEDDEQDQILGDDSTTVIKKGKNMLLVGTPKRSKEKKKCLRNESTETKITKKKIKDYLQIEEDEPQHLPEEIPSKLYNESASTNFKEPSSMAVQVSNTVTSTVGDESIDNDTSATFVPESVSECETLREVAENVLRGPSPSSDDFDF